MASMILSRRDVLLGATATAGMALLPAPLRAAEPGYTLIAQERARQLPGLQGTTPIWSYGEPWPLILRARRRQPFSATLTNKLKEHTTIHWHGVRVPHAMDGVPYITQPPVQPGESFTYQFTPPDPGSYFFHPHCDTLDAMSRGLSGVLIVEDVRDDGLFDVDQVLVLKDWRVKPDGTFDTFTSDADAAKSGTLGNLRTVNGGQSPTITVAPSSRVRLRLVNVDVSRMPLLGLKGADGQVIATDGNAVDPFPVRNWRLGPAMRAEIAFRAPNKEGAEVLLQDVFTNPLQLLARVVTKGAPASSARDSRPLRLAAAELPEPDLKAAKRIGVTLQQGLADPKLEEWMKQNQLGGDALCLSSKILWSINDKAWPGISHDVQMPPMAELVSGQSYVFEIFNGSRYTHPMHLHGHTFRVLSANKRKIPQHWADTVLVLPSEKVEIAFVAGEPGDWMVHCHIIEHQDAGMMAYVRIT